MNTIHTDDETTGLQYGFWNDLPCYFSLHVFWCNNNNSLAFYCLTQFLFNVFLYFVCIRSFRLIVLLIVNFIDTKIGESTTTTSPTSLVIYL